MSCYLKLGEAGNSLYYFLFVSLKFFIMKRVFFFFDDHFWHHLKSVCAYPSVHNSLEGTGLKVKTEGSRVKLTTFEFCFLQLLVDLRQVLTSLAHRCLM